MIPSVGTPTDESDPVLPPAAVRSTLKCAISLEVRTVSLSVVSTVDIRLDRGRLYRLHEVSNPQVTAMQSNNQSAGVRYSFSLLALLLGVALVLSGCDTPASVSPSEQQEVTAVSSQHALPKSDGVEKTSISGEIDLIGVEPPERVLITPGDIRHVWNFLEITEFTGDVEGTVYIDVHSHGSNEGDNFTTMGPAEGEVTWNGRTGTISGQFTTKCEPDASEPTGTSCDGTWNFRGSGGLDGVRFHIEWGPGWFPFPYSGTAFSK